MPTDFCIGDRVESIRDIGPVKFGDQGWIHLVTSGGNLVINWDNGQQFTMLPHEVILIPPF